MHKIINSSDRGRHIIKGLIVAVLMWLLINAFAASAPAADFCALTLNVAASKGLPISHTWVELVDESGNVEVREETVGPTLQICDFDFGPHTLRVGTNECLPVAVSNLRLIIGKPIHLSVILNPCGYQDTMRNACLIYFRVVEDKSRPVPNAEISIGATPQLPQQADSYGRYQRLFRGSEDVLFTKDGFEPAIAHVQCKENEELDLKVVMKRKAR
jgi:hypothetical protein